jgi:penicillin-binding protein 1C
MDEKFEPGKAPVEVCTLHSIQADLSIPEGNISALREAPSSRESVKMVQPTPGLQIAMDPRIPAELQAFAFRISKKITPVRVEWVLNGKLAGETGKDERRFLWPLSRGEYIVQARVWREGQSEPVETPQVAFVVK